MRKFIVSVFQSRSHFIAAINQFECVVFFFQLLSFAWAFCISHFDLIWAVAFFVVVHLSQPHDKLHLYYACFIQSHPTAGVQKKTLLDTHIAGLRCNCGGATMVVLTHLHEHQIQFAGDKFYLAAE